jgi:hypothetical protein
MGLLAGGLNGRRFRVTSKLQDGFRDAFIEAVREHAFVDDLEASDAEPRVGWVHAFDPAKTTFELNDFLFDRFLVLTMRMDKKSVNGAYAKISLARRIEQLCEEKGLKKLSKSETEMVKEALTADLHRRALPSVSTCDVAWDTHTGEVLVFSTSENVVELVRVLLGETFSVDIRAERLCDWLSEKFERKEVIERIDRYLPDARGAAGAGPTIDGHFDEDPLEGALQPIAADFLTWLWLQSESSDGHFRVIDAAGAQEAALAKLGDSAIDDEWNDITESLKHADLTLWLEGRLKLVELAAEVKETTVVVGEAPTTSHAARHDLQVGKQPVEVTMGLKLDELECKMSLSATPGGLAVSGLKLPFEVKKGTDEKVFERMMLMDLVHATLKQLFQQFFLARTSPAWTDRVNAWIADELAAK